MQENHIGDVFDELWWSVRDLFDRLPTLGIWAAAFVLVAGIVVLWREPDEPPVVSLSGAFVTQPPTLTASPSPPPTATLTPTPPPSATAPATFTPSVPPPTEPPDLGILASPTPTPPVYPAQVNGVPLSSFVVLPPGSEGNMRAIYAVGRSLGRDPRRVARAGDSVIENPHFLARFDEAAAGGFGYNLGAYAGLQPVIDHYRGSFGRQGVAVQRGMHAWTLMDSIRAPAGTCFPNEGPVACEIRIANPSVMFIRVGTNDVGVPASFEAGLREAIETCIAQGVIPIIGTKADRRDGPDSPNNAIMRRLAVEYAVPLWDFDRVAATLPGRGLDADNAHLTTYFAHDYTQAVAFTRGYAMQNLTALMALDAVWRVVSG